MAAVHCFKRSKCCGLKCNNDVTQPNRKSIDVDAAYAWLIALAAFFAHLLIYGVVYCCGVFYEIFREIFGGSSSMISLTAILSTTFTYGFSPIPGVLMNKYGQRSITMVGGLLAGTGIILSAFATNVYFMTITFGVITGIGFGTAYLAVVSIVALYFSKYRSIAYGLATSGAGFGTFVYPPIIRLLANEYGERGTLLIIGGATLNICVCGALMHPPITRPAESVTTRPQQETGLTPAVPWRAETRNSCLSLLNLHMFKNTGYLFFCLNNFLVIFGMSIVYVHLTAYCMTKDVDKDTAAMLISVLGISNFVGQWSFGLLGKLHCGPLMLYCISFSLSGLVVLLLPLMTGFIGLALMSAAFGFFVSCFGPLVPQIITDFLSVKLLPSGYGYLMVFEAVGSLLGPPAAGWLYDVLEQYPPSFYLSGATLGISGLMMILPFYMRRQPPVLVEKDILRDERRYTKETLFSSTV